MRERSGGWIRFHSAVENSLFSWIGICSTCLMVAQLILSIPATRLYLSRVTSVAATSSYPATMSATVTIHALDDGSDSAVVLVNGTKTAYFQQGVATLSIRPDDVITIEIGDLGMHRFEIDHNNPQLFLPAPGQIVESTLGESGSFSKARFVEQKLR